MTAEAHEMAQNEQPLSGAACRAARHGPDLTTSITKYHDMVIFF